MDMKVSSTLGYERAHNPILAIGDEGEFVEQALAKLGPQPPNFQAIVELNRGPLVTDGVELLPLAPRQVELKRSDGALLVDVRTDQQFDDAHIPDAVCIPMLRAGFGSKLAWIADREQEIVLIGRDDEDGRVAGRLAVAVGLRKLGGYLHGGMTSWRQEGREAAVTERLALDDLVARMDADAGVQILDVREKTEWDEGAHPGFELHALARHPRGPRRPGSREADRGDVRLWPACGHGSQPRAAPRRAKRDPRGRRRRAEVGAVGPAAGDATKETEAPLRRRHRTPAGARRAPAALRRRPGVPPCAPPPPVASWGPREPGCGVGAGVVEVSVSSVVVVSSLLSSGVVGTRMSAGVLTGSSSPPPPPATTAITTIRKIAAASAATSRRRR